MTPPFALGVVVSLKPNPSSCPFVSQAWAKVLEFIFALEPTLVFESNYDILHLNFPCLNHDLTVIWLLGCYLEFIEEESVTANNGISGAQLSGFLGAKFSECKYRAMPSISKIPGLGPSGIG